MTTASSLPFSNMENPVLDDTMEMGSPYLGQADDFEIDLDVMEDQASNPDKDMTVDDALPDNQDGANDADMADDTTESAMVDADDNQPEENYGVEMQYGEEQTYEAEMLEDDYDEDIDAPVPDQDQQDHVSVTLEDANDETEAKGEVQDEPVKDDTTEQHQENPVAQPVAQNEQEKVDVPNEQPDVDYEQHDEQDTENISAAPKTDQDHSQQPEEPQPTLESVDNTNNTERADPQILDDEDGHDEQAGVKEPEEEVYVAGETQAPVDEPQEKEAAPAEKNDADESAEQVTDEEPHTVLHPIKVYYQESEISLFPPREGDSSETFFLGDENLAYGSFDKLLGSCREVLHEHIGENEVLVVDVDSLGIQLTEDSLHLSKVTLHQIVDLYLLLCRNDGIDEPEALYLSLSTKLAVPAEISDLFSAATEGKGLSEIHPWDDYDATEGIEAEAHNQDQTDQEPQHEVSGQDTEKQEDTHQQHDSEEVTEEVSAKNTVGLEHAHDEQKEQEEHDEKPQDDLEDGTHDGAAEGAELEAGPVEGDASAEDVEEGEYVNVTQDKQGEENHGEDAPTDADGEQGYEEPPQEPEVGNEIDGHPSPNEESYDSEAQKTESTATVAGLPATDPEADQQHAGESTNEPYNGQATHETQDEYGDHDNYYEAEDNGDGEHYEENANVDALEHAEEPHDTSNAYDEASTAEQGQDTNQSHDNNEPEHGDEHGPDDFQDEFEESENVAVEPLPNENGDALPENFESTAESKPSSTTDGKTRETPEPADDLLGFDDFLESPSKAPNGVEESKDQSGSVEVHDQTEPVSTANDDVGDSALEDGEYIDLGIEGFDEEAGEPSVSESKVDNISTKRTRDPEDEFELDGDRTPDAKRSRSS